ELGKIPVTRQPDSQVWSTSDVHLRRPNGESSPCSSRFSRTSARSTALLRLVSIGDRLCSGEAPLFRILVGGRPPTSVRTAGAGAPRETRALTGGAGGASAAALDVRIRN